MKQFLDSERWNEKMRMIVLAALTGAILLFAMLFPLAFRQKAEAEPVAEPLALDARSALFAAYWEAGEGQDGFLAETPFLPDKAFSARCDALMAEIISVCIADVKVTDLSPTGRDYITLTDGEADVNVCRMWLEREGDWRNWLDVCFDVDSGEIYYLYLSCEKLAEDAVYDGYVKTLEAKLGELLQKQAQGTLRYRHVEGENAEIAVISGSNGTVCYRIGGMIYDKFIDVKLNCF